MTDESTLKCPIEKAHKDKEWSTKHYAHQQRLSNMRQDENQNLGRTVMLWCVCGGGSAVFSTPLVTPIVFHVLLNMCYNN